MSIEEKQEGLVLCNLDYKERERIITLFTPESGLMSLIVKNITRKKSHLLALTAPLTHAEFSYAIRRSELYMFQDGTILNAHYSIRDNLSHIQAATTFANALLKTQLPGKAAPLLFRLTLTYLKYLPTFEDPASLVASFLLKLLKNEGHLSLRNTCCYCTSQPTHLFLGEPVCAKHASLNAHFFGPEEWQLLDLLTNTREISLLKSVTLPPTLEQKVRSHYEEKLAQII